MNTNAQNGYQIADYHYELPSELIAQHPAAKRDASNLLVLHRNNGTEHRVFSDIIEYLNAGDVLVLNQTKVLPARLLGHKDTGASCELLLLRQIQPDVWETLAKPGRRIRVGDVITFGDGALIAHIIGNTDAGGRLVRMEYRGNFYALLDAIGVMPLPPYIKEKPADPSRYQTVYAQQQGSAAAPTAGLHFTENLLKQTQQKGVAIAKVLLHVGLGTFRPVEAEDIRQHHMHAEAYQVEQHTADAINAARKNGGRIIAVGTTSVRTLETVADADGIIHPGQGETDIFIYPGYTFKAVDAMITNFHLPESTLLMLISAFAGRERILSEYNEAVKRQYRFFSFGDAMLIL